MDKKNHFFLLDCVRNEVTLKRSFLQTYEPTDVSNEEKILRPECGDDVELEFIEFIVVKLTARCKQPNVSVPLKAITEKSLCSTFILKQINVLKQSILFCILFFSMEINSAKIMTVESKVESNHWFCFGGFIVPFFQLDLESCYMFKCIILSLFLSALKSPASNGSACGKIWFLKLSCPRTQIE